MDHKMLFAIYFDLNIFSELGLIKIVIGLFKYHLIGSIANATEKTSVFLFPFFLTLNQLLDILRFYLR